MDDGNGVVAAAGDRLWCGSQLHYLDLGEVYHDDVVASILPSINTICLSLRTLKINFDEEEDDIDEMEETPEELLSYGTCIVCQEELNSARSFGTLGLVQPSRLLRTHPDNHSHYLGELLQMSPSLDRTMDDASSFSFPPSEAQAEDATGTIAPNFNAFPLQHTRFGLHSSCVYQTSTQISRGAESPREDITQGIHLPTL
ncbi:hypothetical protein BJ138DRAFT_1195040 [Hygrophoropsis aurantiaca]|uniref:Uncharacterized protein n=1 Tax=Hygrophoropsis aurantiaca TaxID=72124 RepID=A0ACB7ZQ29_9AGAM|nr:hypothetical protein BJ138DRAFT_1195040 [Hygrophoropsis aurantiaca]